MRLLLLRLLAVHTMDELKLSGNHLKVHPRGPPLHHPSVSLCLSLSVCLPLPSSPFCTHGVADDGVGLRLLTPATS